VRGLLRLLLTRLRASAGADNGSGCRTTKGTLSTDAQRRREKERLMCGVV
jgi:hypothetical protein